MLDDQNILVRNGYVATPVTAEFNASKAEAIVREIATVVANLAHYGYAGNPAVLGALSVMNKLELSKWWKDIEPILQAITGTDRKMEDAVVYKNFPREVLEMDAATQVFHQILIYLGVPYEGVAQPEDSRPVLGDMARLKVLALADDSTADTIYSNLVGMRNRWSENQSAWAKRLIGDRPAIAVDDFAFKENGVALAALFFDSREVITTTATDVLRLAAALSEQDVSLREKVVFRRFKRAERRRLVMMIEQGNNIAEDFALRAGVWKRLLTRLHPGDFKAATRTIAAYDLLYRGETKTFAAQVDPQEPNEEILDVAATRAGEYLRRLHHFYDLFGSIAVDRFLPVMDRLTTRQLVNLRGYLRTINDRTRMIYPPKSNWTRAQVKDRRKKNIAVADIARLDERIGSLLANRLGMAFPEGLAVDPAVAKIKLQTNDQKLAEYGRGTVFDIPPEMTFIRSASYWDTTRDRHVFYDNSWNFFHDNWSPAGEVCWNNQHGVKMKESMERGAIFSGDPSNMLTGRSCQMIDLYLDRLVENGIRYAVWSVLCYSRKKFSEAKEVLATLQMGEDAETGKLYEPSRAQMVFPLTSDSYTSYVAYIDLKERRLIYMDAPLRSNTTSADANGGTLSELMPAYVEYLDSLPSVHDLVRDAHPGTMPVRFSDAGETITAERAFVFRPENADNDFKRVSIEELLN